MRPTSTDRGLSEVVGFMLVFTMVILSFTVYQGIEVPEQNRAVEFEHNQAVQAQLQDLRNAILAEATTGSSQAISLALGADYPDRTFARNLGVSGGALQTVAIGADSRIQLANATATGRYGETEDVWNGSTHNYETRAIVYRPVYTFYSGAPVTRYAHSLVVNRFENTTLAVTDQSLVNGRQVTLVALAGNLSQTGTGTVSVDPRALSASTERLAVRNESAPIVITLPTRLNASLWSALLADEPHVVGVESAGQDRVRVRLEAGVTYDLRLAKVGVGTGGEAPSAEYLTLRDRPSPTVSTGSTHYVELAVRDRYANPVSGVDVSGSVSGDGSLQVATVASDASGTAVFAFTAPSAESEETLTFSIDGGSGAAKTVEVSLDVQEANAGGGSGSCGIGSDCNDDAFQWSNLAGFVADHGQDEWSIDQLQVQDNDDDDDLDRIELQVTEASGTVVGSRTIDVPDDEYDGTDLMIHPDDPAYNLENGETYTLTATVFDQDGNTSTETAQDTVPGGPSG